MRNIFTKQLLTLQPGQVISGVAGRIQTLRVLQGRVWITVEGISHDYWLSAGDTFTAIPGRWTVIEADRVDSRIDFVPSVRWLDTLKLLMMDLASQLALRHTVTVTFRRHGAELFPQPEAFLNSASTNCSKTEQTRRLPYA